MNRVMSLLRQDFKLLLRNALFWVLTVALVLIVVTVWYLIPREQTGFETRLAVYGMEFPGGGVEIVASPGKVEQMVREKGVLGIVREDGALTVVHDGLSRQAVTAFVAQIMPPQTPLSPIQIERLREAPQPVPHNLRFTPIFIAFEAVIVGFFMAAILMLGERQEGVLEAYRVSPGGMVPYVASKSLLFAIVGTVYALLMAFATVGFAFNIWQFIILTVLGSLFYTLLGMCVAVFFEDISSWFLAVVPLWALNMLPMISFSVPTFSPPWIEWIPSYSALFAYDEILFPTGKSLLSVYSLLGVETIAAFFVCAALVKRRLLSARGCVL